MSTSRKIVLSLVILALAGTIAGVGTYSAFTATTSNTGNSFSTGTVSISDNDGGSAMWSVSGKKPGDTVTACIAVTYSGSLPATVSLYTSASSGTLGQYLTMTVDKVTYSGAGPTFPSCGTPATSTNLYTGDLASFTTSHANYSNGVQTFPGSQTQWNQNDVVYYRFTLTVQNNAAAQGLSATTSFTWEANNQ